MCYWPSYSPIGITLWPIEQLGPAAWSNSCTEGFWPSRRPVRFAPWQSTVASWVLWLEFCDVEFWPSQSLDGIGLWLINFPARGFAERALLERTGWAYRAGTAGPNGRA